MAIGCQRGRARPGAEVVADTGHQAAHLIGNRSHVDGLFAEYGQAGVLSGSGNEQGLIVILGNDLLHRPAVEAPTSSGGDAVQRRRTRGQDFRGVLRHQRGFLNDQPVGGQNNRIDNMGNLDKIVQHPCEAVLRC